LFSHQSLREIRGENLRTIERLSSHKPVGDAAKRTIADLTQKNAKIEQTLSDAGASFDA